MRSHIRLFLGLGIAAVVIIIAIFATSKILSSANLFLMIAPESATIEINGKEYKNGLQRLMPGRKHIKISGEGIEGYETDIDCGLFSTNKLIVYLKKNGSYDSYISSKNDYIILKQFSTPEDKQAEQLIKKVEKAKEFLTELPLEIYTPADEKMREFYKTEIYDGTQNSLCKAAICVLYNGEYSDENRIKQEIEFRGYDPSNYSLIQGEI